MSPFDASSGLIQAERTNLHSLELQPWDTLLRVAIVLGIVLMVGASLHWRLYQPLLHIVDEHH